MGLSGLNPTDDEGGPDYAVTSATQESFGYYILVHEIHEPAENGFFRHRAVLKTQDGNVDKSGHWVDESGISYVEHNGSKYYVATDIWQPMFPEFFQAVGPYGGTDISATKPAFEDLTHLKMDQHGNFFDDTGHVVDKDHATD